MNREDITVISVTDPSGIHPFENTLYVWQKGYDDAPHWKCYLYGDDLSEGGVPGIGASKEDAINDAFEWWDILDE